MSKEKQIEGIKDCIDGAYGCDCAYFGVEGLIIADAIYAAGYRKQIEGHWMVQGLANPKCSVCKTYNNEKRNYCPECGAIMTRPKEPTT